MCNIKFTIIFKCSIIIYIHIVVQSPEFFHLAKLKFCTPVQPSISPSPLPLAATILLCVSVRLTMLDTS